MNGCLPVTFAGAVLGFVAAGVLTGAVLAPEYWQPAPDCDPGTALDSGTVRAAFGFAEAEQAAEFQEEWEAAGWSVQGEATGLG